MTMASDRTGSLSCGDKGYYDKALSSYVYPTVYALWAQREHSSRRPYAVRHQDTKQLLRRILVDYLAEFCEKNKVNSLSRSLAIYLFDYFDSSTLLTNLSLAYPYNRDLLCADHAVLLMQSCLLVAAKVEDIHYNVPNATDFRTVTMQDSAVTNYLQSCNFPIKPGTQAFDSVVSRLKLPKFPLENYRDMELRILRQFNWSVNFPTIASFLGAFITELNLMQKAVPLNAVTAQLPLFIKELVTHAEYLSELALQRPELLYVDLPSHLAAACMLGAYTINTSNNWNLPASAWHVRGITLVRQAIDELSVMINAAIAKVAPQVQLNSQRFVQLLSAVLASHSENQGEKLPATPPPDPVDHENNVMMVCRDMPVVEVPYLQAELKASGRSSRPGKHPRPQHQSLQRQHPYTMTSSASSSSSISGSSSLPSMVAKTVPSFLEQLTPPETPPIITNGCGKSAVGVRCVNAGNRQRVILVLERK